MIDFIACALLEVAFLFCLIFFFNLICYIKFELSKKSLYWLGDHNLGAYVYNGKNILRYKKIEIESKAINNKLLNPDLILN